MSSIGSGTALDEVIEFTPGDTRLLKDSTNGRARFRLHAPSGGDGELQFGGANSNSISSDTDLKITADVDHQSQTLYGGSSIGTTKYSQEGADEKTGNFTVDLADGDVQVFDIDALTATVTITDSRSDRDKRCGIRFLSFQDTHSPDSVTVTLQADTGLTFLVLLQSALDQ